MQFAFNKSQVNTKESFNGNNLRGNINILERLFKLFNFLPTNGSLLIKFRELRLKYMRQQMV